MAPSTEVPATPWYQNSTVWAVVGIAVLATALILAPGIVGPVVAAVGTVLAVADVIVKVRGSPPKPPVLSQQETPAPATFSKEPAETPKERAKVRVENQQEQDPDFQRRLTQEYHSQDFHKKPWEQGSIPKEAPSVEDTDKPVPPGSSPRKGTH